MKKLMYKMDKSILRTRQAIHNFLTNDRGDTNFISIAIILVVVIAVAVAFIAFKDKVLLWFNKAIEDLGGKMGGGQPAGG